MLIEITGNRIGSNPGGKCLVNSPRMLPFEAYIKYCPGYHFPHSIGLNARNQPVYEAVTNSLARILGLEVADFFVLVGAEGVNFKKREGVREEFGGGRVYFVSKTLPKPTKINDLKLYSAMEKERIYRDLLGVEDIEGRANNYVFYPDDGDGRLVYLDLGCSLGIHAKEGSVTIRGKISDAIMERKTARTLTKEANRYVVDPKGSSRTLCISDLLDGFHLIGIPILGETPTIKRLEHLLSEQEIETLKVMLVLCMTETFRKNRHSGVIVRVD